MLTLGFACAHEPKPEEPVAAAQTASKRLADADAFGDPAEDSDSEAEATTPKKGAGKVIASGEGASKECTKKFDIIYISPSKVFFAPITRENLEKAADSTFTTSSCELEKMTTLVRRAATSGNADKADVRIRVTDLTDNFVYFLTMDARVASGNAYREVPKDNVKAIVADIQTHLP